MAENKKSFLLYTDIYHTVKKLPKEKAGELFLTILSYVNDENPVVDDLIIDLVFEPIKRQLKRDLLKYEESKGKYSEAGKASVLARRLKKEQLYILHAFDENEEFLKIGITSGSVGGRYSSSGSSPTKNIPYNFEILFQYLYEEGNISTFSIEQKILKSFSKEKYTPKKKFKGHDECLNINCLERILTMLKNDSEIERCSNFFNDVKILQRLGTVNVNANVNVNDTVTDSKILTKENTAAVKKENSFPKFKTKKDLQIAAAKAMIFCDENLDQKFVEKQSKILASKMFEQQPIKNLNALASTWLQRVDEPQQKKQPEEIQQPPPIEIDGYSHIPKLNGNGYVYPTIKGKYFNKDRTMVLLEDSTWQQLNDRDKQWALTDAITPEQIYKGKK